MRERLVELLQEASTEAGKHFRETTKKVLAEKGRFNSAEDIDRKNIYEIEADYLLTNGIIAPPYKICETLYLVLNNKIIQATVKEITKNNAGLYYKVETEFGLMLRATAACLCLTREEAEEKIKKEKE